MMDKQFNLVDSPWIPVRYLDGTEKELSLEELFAQAEKIYDLSGELPTQSVSILRMLLAILIRSQTYRDNDTLYTLDREQWAALWESPSLLFSDIKNYLAEQEDRFYLFHPNRPFMQVANLRNDKDELKSVASLIPDLPANNDLFTTRSRNETTALEMAEATRWLITLHSWDTSGIRSGAVGDPRVKGGRGYPIGQGWLGQSGVLIVKGKTLFQTLLLNTVPTDLFHLAGLSKCDFENDLPPWEREPEDNQCQRGGTDDPPIATGPVDLLTWQSRRVRLQREGNKVTGVLICQGDKASGHLWSRKEPMSLWRYSPNKSKEKKIDTYTPKTHKSSEQVWRGLPSILADGLQGTVKGLNQEQIPRYLTSATIKSLPHLPCDNIKNQLVIEIVGMEYGNKAASYEELISDRIVLPTILFYEAGNNKRQLIKDTLSVSSEVVFLIGQFAADLQIASGRSFGTGTTVRTVIEQKAESCYHELDHEFRRWLHLMENDSNLARKKWRKVLENLVYKLKDELVRNAGPRCFSGTKSKNKNGNMDLISALRKFEISVFQKLSDYYQESE